MLAGSSGDHHRSSGLPRSSRACRRCPARGHGRQPCASRGAIRRCAGLDRRRYAAAAGLAVGQSRPFRRERTSWADGWFWMMRRRPGGRAGSKPHLGRLLARGPLYQRRSRPLAVGPCAAAWRPYGRQPRPDGADLSIRRGCPGTADGRGSGSGDRRPGSGRQAGPSDGCVEASFTANPGPGRRGHGRTYDAAFPSGAYRRSGDGPGFLALVPPGGLAS